MQLEDARRCRIVPHRGGARARNHVRLGFVFGSRSSKEEKAAATDKVSADLSQPRNPQAPKGRPTDNGCGEAAATATFRRPP